MKKTILALSSLLLIGCAVKLTAPTQADADRVQTKYPNYTLAELNQGKAMYEQHCAECHGLKNPAKFKESELQKYVPGMVRKYNKKFPSHPIDDQTKDLILKYAVTMSKQPK